MNTLVPFYVFNLVAWIEAGLGALLKNKLASPALHGPDKCSCFAFSSVQTSPLYSLVFTIVEIIVKHREFRRELWIGENAYRHYWSWSDPLFLFCCGTEIPPLITFVQMVHLRVPQSKVFLAEDLKKINIPTSNLWESLPVYYDTLLHYNTWQQKKKPTLHKTSRTH